MTTASRNATAATETEVRIAAIIAAIERPMRAQARVASIAPTPTAPGPRAPFVDRDRACCTAAVRLPCVCAVAWRCPTHGETHYGTHD